MVLDIYEEILNKNGANFSEWRPRIEHAQIFSHEDLKRIGKLGGKYVGTPMSLRLTIIQVIASVQPTHA